MATAATISSSMADLCIICQTLPNGKPKPGILPCLGCEQLFCYLHIGQHRQYLRDQLDTIVINKRNSLCEIISKLEENCDQYTVQQLKDIDDWEIKSHEVIRQVAVDARETLHEMALNECDNLRARFATLSAELNDRQETENYFEQDIDLLTDKFHQLKQDIENFALKIDVNVDLQTIELINIKKKPSSLDSFIDHLLLTQKPVKVINVRNRGTLHAVKENILAFEYNGARDIDLYNTVDGSFKTMSRPGDSASSLCYSTYLQSFIYLIQQLRPKKRSDLYQWSIKLNREPEKLDLKNIEKTSTITCYETDLIAVSYEGTIEKWKLNGLKLDARWQKPMSCERNESIQDIRMNSQYYALVIKKIDGYYFQLRNSAMSIIGNVEIEYNYFFNLKNLPNESGWLFINRFLNTNHSYVIDNQLNKYEQKYILALNIKDVVVQGNNLIIRYGEQANSINKTKRGHVEYYEWK